MSYFFKGNKFPFKITDLDEEINKNLKNDFRGNKGDYILVGPKKYCLWRTFKELCPVYYNFPIRTDDVWLFGYPCSGITIMREMLWLIGNNLNYKKASETIVDLRCYFLENDPVYNITPEMNKNMEKEENILIINEFNTPVLKKLLEINERRFIRTHLPISLINPDLLTSGCKVVYIMRNPKDIIVSRYFLEQSGKYIDFNGTLEDYWKYFQQGVWDPYLEHIKEGWKYRHNPNFLFLFYEEIAQDMRKVLKKVGNFLQVPLNDPQLDKLENYFHINNFCNNTSVNNDWLCKKNILVYEDNTFIRKANVNGWMDYLTEQMNNEFNQWIEKNVKAYDF